MPELDRVVIVACMNPVSKTGVTTHYTLLQKHIDDFEVTTVTSADAPWLIRKIASAYFLACKMFFPNNAFVVTRYYLFLLRFALKRKVAQEKVHLFHAQDPIAAFSTRRLFKKTHIITTSDSMNPIGELQIR